MADRPHGGSASSDDEVSSAEVAELERRIATELQPAIEPARDPAAASGDRRQVRALDLPGLIGGVLTDIRAIAEGMAVLPKLLTSLNSIDQKVETLNDEVHRMRMRVDQMESNVDDVTKALHPLRRVGGRRRARGIVPPDAEL